MASKDSRRNALVAKQSWEELGNIDVKSFDDYLSAWTRGNKSLYLFSGHSDKGTIRVDWRKDTNANLVGDVFVLIDQFKENSFDVVVYDPYFEVCYNPNKAVWEKAIKKGKMPESTRDTPYFGHNNKWIQRAFELVKPGGLMIGKHDIRNVNIVGFSALQMFYVHDARPMGFNVRVYHK